MSKKNFSFAFKLFWSDKFESIFFLHFCNFRIRGQLGTVFMYCRNSGILIAYILGTYMTYITSSYYFIGITLMFLIAIWFVPSTPQHHLRKNNLVSAQKSFNFYNKHRLQNDPKFCMVQFDSLREVANDNTSGPKLTWKDISECVQPPLLWHEEKLLIVFFSLCVFRFISVDSRNGMLQAIIFSILNVLTAQIVFLTYGSSVIKESGTDLSPGVASIIMGVVQLFVHIFLFCLQTWYIIWKSYSTFLFFFSSENDQVRHIHHIQIDR